MDVCAVSDLAECFSGVCCDAVSLCGEAEFDLAEWDPHHDANDDVDGDAEDEDGVVEEVEVCV